MELMPKRRMKNVLTGAVTLTSSWSGSPPDVTAESCWAVIVTPPELVVKPSLVASL